MVCGESPEVSDLTSTLFFTARPLTVLLGRQWANSYFSEMILDLTERKPHLLLKETLIQTETAAAMS